MTATPSPSVLSPLWIALTAFLWGATDPLLKRFGRDAVPEDAASDRDRDIHFARRVARDLGRFFSDWRYAAAFAANQLGSVTFLVALSTNPVSTAAPAANGLKFVFNAAAGKMLGEESPSPATAVGLALIVVGSLLHMLD